MGATASQITSLTIVYSTAYSGAYQRKHQSSASLAFVRGIHRYRWIPHTKDQWRGKCFHLMTSSWGIIWQGSLSNYHDDWRWLDAWYQDISNSHDDVIKGPETWTLMFSLILVSGVSLNKRLKKPPSHRWLEAPGCSLWRHCNVYCWPLLVGIVSESLVTNVTLPEMPFYAYGVFCQCL